MPSLKEIYVGIEGKGREKTSMSLLDVVKTQSQITDSVLISLIVKCDMTEKEWEQFKKSNHIQGGIFI